MRQEYYISRQKIYINHLVNQLARHHFLKVACSMEQKSIHGAYSLIRVIESELHGYLSAACVRMGHYLSASQVASEICEQGAVDDRDTFLHSIRDFLSIHSNAQGTRNIYVSAHGIIQKISNLQSDLCSLQFELENSLPEDRRKCINNLCVLIQSLEQLLVTPSYSAEPILTPRLLVRALDEMEKVHAQLSVWIENVINARRVKDELLVRALHDMEKVHAQLSVSIENVINARRVKAEVFVDFFSNPDRLRSQTRELTARVKALQE